MKFFDVFAGIGGFRMGLESVGFECVASCEWDKYARISYKAIYEGDEPFYGNITEVDARELPDFDLLVGGFPCQAFSVAGKRGGFEDTRGTMFFELARIAEQVKPRLLLFENVKGLLSHDKGNTFGTILNTLDELGYDCEWQMLNSKDFGVPQNRERVFIIGHLRGTGSRKVFPIFGESGRATREIGNEPKIIHNIYGGFKEEKPRVFDIAPTIRTSAGGGHIPSVMLPKQLSEGEGVSYALDANYHKGISTLEKARRTHVAALTERRTEEAKAIRREMMAQGKDWSPRRGKELVPRDDGMANTVTATQTVEQMLTDGIRIRKLTPRECWRLQGFPDWAFDKAQQAGVSDTQLYRQAGNAVTVNVARAIGQAISLHM